MLVLLSAKSLPVVNARPQLRKVLKYSQCRWKDRKERTSTRKDLSTRPWQFTKLRGKWFWEGVVPLKRAGFQGMICHYQLSIVIANTYLPSSPDTLGRLLNAEDVSTISAGNSRRSAVSSHNNFGAYPGDQSVSNTTF